MNHRSYDGEKQCRGCRYWSEMIAGNMHNGGGDIEAMCLNPTSPASGKYMGGHRTCANWASGHNGAIDEPGQDPRAYDQDAEQFYAQEREKTTIFLID